RSLYTNALSALFVSLLHVIFFYSYGDLRGLHSFPTRRSSDLLAQSKESNKIESGDVVGSTTRRQAMKRMMWVAPAVVATATLRRSEEHTSELQSRENLVCRLLLEKKKTQRARRNHLP